MSRYSNNNNIDIKEYIKCTRINKNYLSSIYQVKKKDTGKIFAAKTIENISQMSDMIESDIESIINISHPTIEKIYGYSKLDFSNKNNITIIMELAKNHSFFDYITNFSKKNKFDNLSTTSQQIILVGISCGMNHLHKNNIIHRDLQASNVLLDENNYPKITDFYMSKIYSKSQTKFVRKIKYFAPEILKKQQYNNKIDVYAFGILMYEIVTNSIAFPELEIELISKENFTNKIVKENYRPAFETSLNENIKSLIEQCWNDDPDKRPTFDEIFTKLITNEFLLDGVDINKLNDYIESIKVDQIEDLEQEEKDDSNMTIDEFNSLPLKSKQTVCEDLLINKNKKNEFLNQINQLICFFIQNDIFTNSVFEIDGIKDDLLININKDQVIYCLSDTTEKLFELKLMNSSNFIDIIKKFISFCFEIKFPSNLFDKIYYSISKIKNPDRFQSRLNIEMSFLISEFPTDNLFWQIDNKFQLFKQVRFQDSINVIARFAFDKCSSLTKAIIPSSVTSFDEYSFNRCTSLKQIVIPSSVTKIGSSSFNRCSSLTSITIPSSVTQIGSNCFSRCSSLTKITIPSSITIIGSDCFKECSSLEEIIIPSSITSIGEYSFSKCSSLKQITIPSSVTKIGSNCFNDCSSLKAITIPSSITNIESDCFKGCSSLEEITIPSSVTSIGKYSFFKCSSLKKITIPSSVTSIGSNCFNGCSSLTTIIFLSQIAKIESDCFNGCSSLEEITIPSSVTLIGNYSFSNCSSLKQIIIPSSVTKIGDKCFKECTSLEEIIIPSSVTSIGEYSFCNCSSLKKITIPSSVTKIESNCFNDCSSLTSITIPSSITNIESDSFNGCSSLREITIPSSVTSIGMYAFYKCDSLAQVTIHSKNISIGNNAFPLKTKVLRV